MSTPTSSSGGAGSGSGGRRKDQKELQAPASTSDPNVATSGVVAVASRTFTVSVIGFSGAEKERGSVGVGKSCLCNRFVRPLEDEFRTDHISTLSQVDFGGRVVNNDHWLYWGERSLIGDDGCELTFRLIEQTEFVDDESFQTLKGGSSAQREVYAKRCSSIRLQSPDKLMYICKDQLGLESEYEQKILTDGKVSVDGFICVYDVSSVPNRSIERQSEFVAQVLQNVLKAKKPIVFVTTKNDEVDERCSKEAEKLVGRREFRSLTPIVESSSTQNVNVEAGFVLLAHLIEKVRSKPKIMNFNDALKSRREIVDVATTAYVQKLRAVFQDHRVTWAQLCRQLADDSDFQHFCELCGRAAAQKHYRRHLRDLRDRYMQRRLQKQVGKLPEIFPHLAPDFSLLRGKTWDEVLRILPTLPQFPRLFQPVGTLAASLETPNDIGVTSPEDFRLSAEILYTSEAEEYYRNYVQTLEADYRRRKLQEEFLQLLQGCSQVTPGKPLSDLRIFFIGKECFESLSETDLQSIYDQYQRHLIRRARRDFVELLQEQIEEFVSRVLFRPKVAGGGSGGDKSRYLPGLSEQDVRDLHLKLQEDVRYRQLNRLHQARDNMICQYIGFLSFPLRQHCAAEPRCVDTLVENYLENKLLSSKPTSSVNYGEHRLNLAFVGVDGVANRLIQETRIFLNDDDFLMDDVRYSFDFRCIDGDLKIPHSFLCSSHYQANGLICVFSSRSSLDAVRESFVRFLAPAVRPSSFEAVVDPVVASSLVNLPTVFVLACDPTDFEDLPYLQQQGARLAADFRCAFVGLEPSTSNLTADRRANRTSGYFFTEDQIQRVLAYFATYGHSPPPPMVLGQQPPAAASESTTITSAPVCDLKLLICLMCGDDFSPELLLAPFFNHQQRTSNGCDGSTPVFYNGGVGRGFHNEAGTDRRRSFVVETFLPTASSNGKIRAEVTVVAYHTGFVWLAEHVYHHGYILVYSAKRRASLANLYSFAHLIPDVIPLFVIAVGEVAEFFSDNATNVLITEGNDIADRVGARFVTVSKAVEQQMSLFTPFLDEMWTKKEEIERNGLIKWSDDMSTFRVHRNAENGVGGGDDKYRNANYQTPTTTTSHYAHLSQFNSGFWPPMTSPDVGRKAADIVQQRTPPVVTHNRAVSMQSRNSSGDLYRDNELMSRSYVSPPIDPSPASLERMDNSTPSTVNSIYGLKRQTTSSNCNLSTYEQPTPSSINSINSNSTAVHSSARPVHNNGGSSSWWDGGSEGALAAKGSRTTTPVGGGNASPLSVRELNGKKLSPSSKTSYFSSKEEPTPSKFHVFDKASSRNHLSAAAPLATPESIEVGVDYMTVKDALGDVSTDFGEDEQQYATVASVLPRNDKEKQRKGGEVQLPAESSSGESLEKANAYEKTGRKPTPRRREKKKSTAAAPTVAERVRALNAELENFVPPSPPPPPIPPYTRERLFKSSNSHSAASYHPMLRSSASEESLLDSRDPKRNYSVRVARTVDHQNGQKVFSPSSSPSLIRRMASSFRFRRGAAEKMSVANDAAPDEISKSVPQSPVFAERAFVLSSQYQGGVSIEQPNDLGAGGSSSFWLNPSSKTSSGSSSISPKRGAVEKQAKERKISRDILKKYSGEVPAKISANKKRSSKESSQPSSSSNVCSSETSLKDLSASHSDPVPIFVRKCVDFIEAEGLTMEGIYRVPGNQAHVLLLEQRFSEDSSLSFHSMDIPVNAVATALKNFFACLNEPVFPYSIYDDLMASMSVPNNEEKLNRIKHVLSRLDPENRAVLRYFLTHLRKVAHHAHMTAMDHRNLAKCWWPTLLRPQFDSFETMTQMTQRLEEFVQILLDNPHLL